MKVLDKRRNYEQVCLMLRNSMKKCDNLCYMLSQCESGQKKYKKGYMKVWESVSKYWKV
jgi:hypothetical protein